MLSVKHHIISIYFFTEVHCAVPAILNAVPEFGVAEPTEVDIYTCKKGYEFSTGETERTMTCLSDGTWIPDDSCWSKLQLNIDMSGKPTMSVICYV